MGLKFTKKTWKSVSEYCYCLKKKKAIHVFSKKVISQSVIRSIEKNSSHNGESSYYTLETGVIHYVLTAK